MPRFPQVLLFLIGCAHGIEDPLPEIKEKVSEPRAVDSILVIECTLIGTAQFAQCTISTLDCSNNQTEYMLDCPMEFPIGDLEEVPQPYVK